MQTFCTLIVHDAALAALPSGAGLVYAGVTPRRRQYRHGTASSVVEINSTSSYRPADRLFNGKQDVLARLGSRGVAAFDYREFLVIPGDGLAAANVGITDVENVLQRLFVFAAGGLPLGNASTRRDLYLKLPAATAVCQAFGPAIEAAFAALSNDVFMERLGIAMSVLGRWGDGPCARHLPASTPVTGRRHHVPVASQGGGAATPQPTGLLLALTPSAELDLWAGVEPTLYRDADSGPPCPLPGQGANTDANTPEETSEIGILASLV